MPGRNFVSTREAVPEYPARRSRPEAPSVQLVGIGLEVMQEAGGILQEAREAKRVA